MDNPPREIVFLDTDQHGRVHTKQLRPLIEEYADQRDQIAELKAKLAASDARVVLLNEALNRSNRTPSSVSESVERAKKMATSMTAGRNWVDVQSYRRLQTELAAVQTQLEDANQALDFKQSEVRMMTESIEASQERVQTLEVDLENERETSQHLREHAEDMRRYVDRLWEHIKSASLSSPHFPVERAQLDEEFGFKSDTTLIDRQLDQLLQLLGFDPSFKGAPTTCVAKFNEALNRLKAYQKNTGKELTGSRGAYEDLAAQYDEEIERLTGWLVAFRSALDVPADDNHKEAILRAKAMRHDAIELDQEADRLRQQLEQESESKEKLKQRIEGAIGKIAEKIGKQVGYLESLSQDVDPMPF